MANKLIQNMRQEQDSQYAVLLASVRVGSISDEDCAYLVIDVQWTKPLRRLSCAIPSLEEVEVQERD